MVNTGKTSQNTTINQVVIFLTENNTIRKKWPLLKVLDIGGEAVKVDIFFI